MRLRLRGEEEVGRVGLVVWTGSGLVGEKREWTNGR